MPVQTVYVSIYDILPFEYEPEKVKAVTKYIEYVCKSDKNLDQLKVTDKDGKQDDTTKKLIDIGFIELSPDKVTIKKLTEGNRGMSFKVYQQAKYSEYMSMDVWSTIEVRIIC